MMTNETRKIDHVFFFFVIFADSKNHTLIYSLVIYCLYCNVLLNNKSLVIVVVYNAEQNTAEKVLIGELLYKQQEFCNCISNFDNDVSNGNGNGFFALFHFIKLLYG